MRRSLRAGNRICRKEHKLLSAGGQQRITTMTIKYYLGMEEVPRDVYEQAKTAALAAGNGIKDVTQADGLPEYILENGTVIRGNGNGGFDRMVDGQPEEAWMPGTENEWVQQEPTDEGEAQFFFRVQDKFEEQG